MAKQAPYQLGIIRHDVYLPALSQVDLRDDAIVCASLAHHANVHCIVVLSRMLCIYHRSRRMKRLLNRGQLTLGSRQEYGCSQHTLS